jgi:hypothetical protein
VTARTSTSAGTVLAALVTAMRSRSGYRSPWVDGTSVPVYHSAEAGEQAARVERLIVIGDTGNPDAATEGAQTGQRPATLGTRRARQEDLLVHVRIVSQTGDTGPGVIEAQIDAAEAILDDLHDEIAGTGSVVGPTLGLADGTPGTYQLVTARLEGVPALLAYSRAGTVAELLVDLVVEVRL